MVEDANSSFEYYKLTKTESKVDYDLISKIRHKIPKYSNKDTRCPKVSTLEVYDEECKELSADFVNSNWD